MAEKCNLCNGIYNNSLGNGSRYFHACPPIPNPLYQPDPSKPLFNPNPTVERPNKRDENVIIDATGVEAGIKSAGTGVALV